MNGRTAKSGPPAHLFRQEPSSGRVLASAFVTLYSRLLYLPTYRLYVDSISTPSATAMSCVVVDANGTRREGIDVDAMHGVDFVGYESVRSIPSYKGQRSLPGRYWFSMIDQLIPYESRLEMMILMQLDYEAECIDVLPQPLALHFKLDDGTTPWHVPDFLLSLPEGQFLLVDVKPHRHAEKPRNRTAFSLTQAWCDRLGWEYRVLGEHDEIYQRNLKWLAGFRRRPPTYAAYAGVFMDSLAGQAMSIAELLALVNEPVLARPVLFHLLWRQHLMVDMFAPLEDSSRVVLSSRRWAA